MLHRLRIDERRVQPDGKVSTAGLAHKVTYMWVLSTLP